MKQFTNDEKQFVIESFRRGASIAIIVRDLKEIYGYGADAADAENEPRVDALLTDRVKKIKHSAKDEIEALSAKPNMAHLNARWRERYFREMLADTDRGEKSLRVKLLKELRAEQKILYGACVELDLPDDHPAAADEPKVIDFHEEAEKLGPTPPLDAEDYDDWVEAGSPHYGEWRMKNHFLFKRHFAEKSPNRG